MDGIIIQILVVISIVLNCHAFSHGSDGSDADGKLKESKRLNPV